MRWLILLVMLVGCDRAALQQLHPGRSTAVEVRDALGAPSAVWPGNDGQEVWEFSRQPEGSACYLATMGADQVLQRIDEVGERDRAAIQPGMEQAVVRRRLCKPGSISEFPARGESVWRWHIDARMPGERSYFVVTFDRQGKVLSTGEDADPGR